jgi:carbohydrate-selective porin OprB
VPAVRCVDEVSPNQGLLGDWGGLRTRLYQKGVDFQLGHTTEPAYVQHPGGTSENTDVVVLGLKESVKF